MSESQTSKPNPYEVHGPTVQFGPPAQGQPPQPSSNSQPANPAQTQWDSPWRAADPTPPGYQPRQNYQPYGDAAAKSAPPTASLPPAAQPITQPAPPVSSPAPAPPSSQDPYPLAAGVTPVPPVLSQPAGKRNGCVIALAVLVGAIALFALGMSVGWALGARTSSQNDFHSMDSAPNSGLYRSPPTAPPSPDAAGSFGDGIYFTNVDLQPGTYSAPGGRECYWQRAGSSDLGETTPLETSEGPGPFTVTIESEDFLFFTEGCGTWVRQN